MKKSKPIFNAFLVLLLPFFSAHLLAVEVTMPLSQIYPTQAVELKCIDSKYDVQIPIPQRWDVKRAKLRFSYVNSASLLRKNSQLVVRLNGTPLAQMKLDPNAPEGKAEVDLPKLLLQPGYNELSFAVSQHYAEQCELPCVPELWTRINLDQAEISFDYQLRDVPLSIASISNFLFDAKNVDYPKVHLITENNSDQMITSAALVASGIALRYEYRPVQFSTSDSLMAGIDNILIGSNDFISNFLNQFNMSIDTTGPQIHVLPLPLVSEHSNVSSSDELQQENLSDANSQSKVNHDKTHALIIITGQDIDQISLAVESFDILSIPFPDSNQMQIQKFELPKIALYSGKQMVTPGKEYPFKKLDFSTFTFRGFSSGHKAIDFRVPPDFLIKPNQYVTVSLNFAYGAGFRIDSVLNVVLNGEYVSSIHLDNPRGALVSNYKLTLPTYLFRGGMNQLSFSPVLTPLITENCSFIHAENLFLTLFNSSSFTFPEMPHQIEMPRLDLLFVNGFPFTRWPDGYKSTLHLTQIDNKHLSAAYNMIGLISQKNGYPLLGIKLSSKLVEPYDGELMLISTIEKLPEKYRLLAPLQLGQLNKVPYPVYSGIDKRSSLAFSTQKSEMGISKGGIMQFESPDVPGRSITLLTAQNSDAIERLSIALQESSVQSAVNNDLTLLDFIYQEQVADEDSYLRKPWRYVATSLQVGDSYLTGKEGEISPVKAILSRNKILYWGLTALVIIALVWILGSLIKRQKQQRNPHGNDET